MRISMDAFPTPSLEVLSTHFLTLSTSISLVNHVSHC